MLYFFDGQVSEAEYYPVYFCILSNLLTAKIIYYLLYMYSNVLMI